MPNYQVLAHWLLHFSVPVLGQDNAPAGMARAARWPARMAAAARTSQAAARTVRASGDALVYRRPPPWVRRLPRAVPPRAMKRALPDLPAWPRFPTEPLRLRAVPSPQSPDLIPVLAHGLSRVLRQRGVHPVGDMPLRRRRRAPAPPPGAGLRDSVSNEAMGDMDRIPQPNEINWGALPPYVTASKDATLRRIAEGQAGVRYSGSTSSMTSALSALYHAVSNFKDTLLLGGLTKSMAELPSTFTRFHKHPVAIAVRPYPKLATSTTDLSPAQMFSIDSHDAPDTSPAILRDLGHAMERMLTMPGAEFREKVLLKEPLPKQTIATEQSAIDAVTRRDVDNGIQHQFYHYSIADSFLLRAQIDCRDEVTGSVFDVKTRAVAAIRYDLRNYLSNSHRVLHRLTGLRDSYEREFYDMVRSVFLKYALQLRIGRMSGAFVAYHNTAKMLGFEFVPLEEIEAYVFGSKTWTDHAFSCCVRLLGRVLDEITAAMPVTHPEYLKVVIAVHYSQKCVHIYAQRVRGGIPDPVGPEKFESIANASPHRRRSEVPPDFDFASSDGFNNLQGYPNRPGVSVVRSDIVGTDLGRLAAISRLAGSNEGVSHLLDPRVVAEHELLHSAEVLSGDLCLWELTLTHFVNGALTGEPIELHSRDTFELRYRLERKLVDDSRLLKDFISVLSNAYYPTSRR